MPRALPVGLHLMKYQFRFFDWFVDLCLQADNGPFQSLDMAFVADFFGKTGVLGRHQRKPDVQYLRGLDHTDGRNGRTGTTRRDLKTKRILDRGDPMKESAIPQR